MQRSLVFVVVSLLLFQFSCKPKIYLFTAEPRTVISKDSVRLKWKVRGTAEVMYDQIKQFNPVGDSIQLLEFTLYVTKGDKPAAHEKRQVTLVTKESIQLMPVRIDSIVPSNDTAIARGITDTSLWKGFSVNWISTILNRPLVVFHERKKDVLKDSTVKSTMLQGLQYSGFWEVYFPLNAAEQSNHALIPSRLLLKVDIRK